jgi:glycosyltransferase involved in cell wall biosynthesis
MDTTKNKVCLVCHGPVTCNSGRHVLSIARELRLLGRDVSICVPTLEGSDAFSVHEIKIQSFDSHIASLNRTEDILYHYWTPREIIREFHISICNRLSRKIKYLIHLEDDEMIILKDQMNLSELDINYKTANCTTLQVPPNLTHPVHGRNFIHKAIAVTTLSKYLLEDVSMLPNAVFWPSYDSPFEQQFDQNAIDSIRRELNIPKGNHIVTYIGNMHFSNADEIRSLYIAVAIVNRMGLPLTLIRTGQDSVPLAEHGEPLLRQHARELGYIPKVQLPLLLQVANILVQPGRDDRWNRMRFPSKLPEFLVSGRPVILPRANLGAALQNGKNAIVLEHATASNIAEALLKWLPKSDACAVIGRSGREFALEHLQWKKAVQSVDQLYSRILQKEISSK